MFLSFKIDDKKIQQNILNKYDVVLDKGQKSCEGQNPEKWL